MRRTATVTLHWVSFGLLILLTAGGPVPGLALAFGITGLGMVVLALTNVLMNDPGPRLEGALRSAHPWLSRAMYLAVGGVAALTLLDQFTGPPVPGDLARIYVFLLAGAALHGIFNLWRHTALNDGALRRMTPKAMHGLL